MILNALFTHPADAGKSVWIGFPNDIDRIKKALADHGIPDNNYIISHYENLLPVLNSCFTPTEDIAALNELAQLVSGFSVQDTEKLFAILTGYEVTALPLLIQITQEIGQYCLLPDIKSNIDLGFYHAGGKPDTGASFVELGKEIQQQQDGRFTVYGYIYKKPEGDVENVLQEA